MRSTYIVLITSLIAFNSSQLKSCHKKINNEFIVWSKDKKLSWDEFKGFVPDSAKIDAGSSITLKLDYRLTNKLEFFEVKCIFYPEKSWVSHTSFYLLKHEQGHFDIGGIIARKFRQKLLDAKKEGNINEKKIELIYDDYLDSLNLMQTLYDKETNHSLNHLEQLKWYQLIEDHLNKLK